ncbi:MAG: hypothetical protein ACR2GP_15980 [Burkholderiaceae bacterium]
MIADIQTQELALELAIDTQYAFVEQAELIHVGGGNALVNY